MKKSPEQIILTVALVLLIGTAGWLAYSFSDPSLVQDITGVESTNPTGHQPVKLSSDDVHQQLAAWTTPADWQLPADGHRLFISDGFIFYPSAYPDGDDVKPVKNDTRTPSGVLISWYQKYGLDFTDPHVDQEDPDGDGFSNIVEFKNDPVGTRQKAADCDGSKSCSPLDPQAHPSYLSRLRMQKYDSRPFHLTFRGYEKEGDTYFFQIYLSDLPSSQQPGLKKTGDQLGVEGYIIGAFHQNVVTKKNPATGEEQQVDESTLEVTKPEINFTKALPYRQEVDSPESTADFIMLMPTERDKVTKVPRGQTFTPPFIPTTYRVMDATDAGAVIQDIKTKENINIPLLDPNEWNEVPPTAGAPAAAKP
jgi:hypothetical protein